jgi:hypothetical protein
MAAETRPETNLKSLTLACTLTPADLRERLALAVQLKAALAAAVRSRVPDDRKAADDAAKAFFRAEPNR